MSERWSQRLATEFAASFTPDVVDWLDSSICDDLGSPHLGGFTEAIDLEQLLDPLSSAIWGGQMLPDTLPLLDNGCGDVISLRFGPDGQVSEMVRWDHEGGSWRPFGNTLAEAVLCDIGTTKVEEPAGFSLEVRHAQRPVEDWAVDWTRRTTAPRLNWSDPYEGNRFSVFQCLLDADICEVVARREQCSASLACGLARRCMEIGGGQIAERLGVPWTTFQDWLFDTALIPGQYHQALSQAVNMPIEQMLRQDWDQASAEAQRVCKLRPDLAWPHVILGWVAERNHDRHRAVDHYLAGLKRLGTSCAFMARVEHGLVVERLGELKDHLSTASMADPNVQAALAPRTPDSFPSTIRCYWIRQAEEAAARGEHDRSYRCYYSAGWDDYITNDMDRVLDGLARSAEAAGYTTLCRLATLHLASLRGAERFPASTMSPTRPRSRIGALITRLLGR
jgi:hypothetical protein